jgi:hypothetical protein
LIVILFFVDLLWHPGFFRQVCYGFHLSSQLKYLVYVAGYRAKQPAGKLKQQQVVFLVR